jgi:hypothetical protein
VFLYNFFHDSECDASQWRVVLNGIDKAHATGIPAFDAIKHIGICSEVILLFKISNGYPMFSSSLSFFMLPLQGHETTFELRTFQRKENP